jgi:hypothetical protein
VKRLLLDQGLPRSSAALLAQQGYDVVHVSDIGMSRAQSASLGHAGSPGRTRRKDMTVGALAAFAVGCGEDRGLASRGTVAACLSNVLLCIATPCDPDDPRRAPRH